ncbi:MAG: DUF4239 domain-containing protein [Pseudonocardia sp.]|nr:DUF4239 domain-containing protein [Pseudonocardia sp.]
MKLEFTTILLPALGLAVLVTGLAWGFWRVIPERFHPSGEAPISAMVSGIVLVFAFTLGLTVSQENTTIKEARDATFVEANSIGELYWYAHTLPEPGHSRLQGLLRDYTKQVVKDFPLLGQHLPSEATYGALRAVRNEIVDYKPPVVNLVDYRSQTVANETYRNALIQVAELFKSRRARIQAATDEGVPDVLIYGLITLVVLILLFIPLSGVLKGARDYIFYAVFATFLIATQFLVADMNNPFAGTVSVQPTAFDILFKETFVHVS